METKREHSHSVIRLSVNKEILVSGDSGGNVCIFKINHDHLKSFIEESSRNSELSFSQNRNQLLGPKFTVFNFLMKFRVSSEPIWGISVLKHKNTVVCTTPDNIKVFSLKSHKNRFKLKERFKTKCKLYFKGHFEILNQDDIDTIKQKMDSNTSYLIIWLDEKLVS